MSRIIVHTPRVKNITKDKIVLFRKHDYVYYVTVANRLEINVVIEITNGYGTPTLLLAKLDKDGGVTSGRFPVRLLDCNDRQKVHLIWLQPGDRVMVNGFKKEGVVDGYKTKLEACLISGDDVYINYVVVLVNKVYVNYKLSDAHKSMELLNFEGVCKF